MGTYFYLDDEMKQQGPCSVEELRRIGIRPDTKVWTATMADWTNAGEVPELVDLFVATPPPVTSSAVPPVETPVAEKQAASVSSATAPAKPDSWLAWSIITALLCCLPLSIPAIIYASKVDGLWHEQRYDEAIRAAKSAKQWTLASVITAVVGWILYILLIALGMGLGIFQGMTGM